MDGWREQETGDRPGWSYGPVSEVRADVKQALRDTWWSGVLMGATGMALVVAVYVQWWLQ